VLELTNQLSELDHERVFDADYLSYVRQLGERRLLGYTLVAGGMGASGDGRGFLVFTALLALVPQSGRVLDLLARIPYLRIIPIGMANYPRMANIQLAVLNLLMCGLGIVMVLFDWGPDVVSSHHPSQFEDILGKISDMFGLLTLAYAWLTALRTREWWSWRALTITTEGERGVGVPL
jgi:hypothetical protein